MIKFFASKLSLIAQIKKLTNELHEARDNLAHCQRQKESLQNKLKKGLPGPVEPSKYSNRYTPSPYPTQAVVDTMLEKQQVDHNVGKLLADKSKGYSNINNGCGSPAVIKECCNEKICSKG